MIYYIINKLENLNNTLKITPIGYVTNIDICILINKDYDDTLGKWFSDNLDELENGNINISSFFNSVPYVYNAKEETNYIKEGLNEINDLTTI